MLKLYHFNEAICGAKVRLTLAEKGVEYVEEIVSRDALVQPEYLHLNPNGVVPTLLHDDLVLIESSVIMNYIEDEFSGSKLRPGAARDRAAMNMWMKLVDEVYHPALGALTYALAARRRYLSMSPEAREASYATIPDPVRRKRRRDVVENGLEASQIPDAMKALGGMLNRLEATNSSQPWLAGEEYSLADAAMTPIVNRIAWFGLLEDAPAAAAWFDRVRARPSYAQVILARSSETYVKALGDSAAPHHAQLVGLMRG
ncbi:glutathione S-transferase family protein [Phenylobacterium sp.]|uniref:glutathione S-transferase family protein n=1 Tax=Phenylobacterium sp. TaxID=1871053 RepID=UPI0035AF373B